VEALIEYDPNHADILPFWNRIRRRAGVPDIETVYPDVVGNQVRMRELIRHERQVELALENHRYFDTRRWQIAERTNNGKIYGMNIYSSVGSPMGKPKDATGNATFYRRSVSENGNRVFLQKHYLWPINQTELNRNRNIEQAPGW
jgi:phage terminase large subunit-like protein